MPKSKEQKQQEAIARAASYFESDREFSPRKRFDSLEEYLDLFRPQEKRAFRLEDDEQKRREWKKLSDGDDWQGSYWS